MPRHRGPQVPPSRAQLDDDIVGDAPQQAVPFQVAHDGGLLGGVLGGVGRGRDPGGGGGGRRRRLVQGIHGGQGRELRGREGASHDYRTAAWAGIIGRRRPPQHARRGFWPPESPAIDAHAPLAHQQTSRV